MVSDRTTAAAGAGRPSAWPGGSRRYSSFRSSTATGASSTPYGLRRGLDEIIAFSADVGSLLKAPSNLSAWGWLHVVNHPEADIFPGLTIVVLVITGLVIGWRNAAKEQIGRLKMARVFVAGRGVFFAIAASPVFFGAWKLDIGGLRLFRWGRRTSRFRSDCCCW